MNQDWLTTGDELYSNFDQRIIRYKALPPELYGAQWLKDFQNQELQSFKVSRDADVFVAIESSKNKPAWINGFGELTTGITLSDGSYLKVYKKKMLKDERIIIDKGTPGILMAQPASLMEPAYDLKPVASYKAVDAKWKGSGLIKGQVDGKDRLIFKSAAADNELEWNFSPGVADIYSLQISYNNPKQTAIMGQIQLVAADGTVMKEEKVEFTPTRPGKSNYISTTTGTMINAGNYKLRLRSREAEGLSINSLDVQ